MNRAYNQKSHIWVQIGSPGLEGRAFHASVVYKHFIVTFGGKTEKRYLNDIMIFDIESEVWPAFKLCQNILQERVGHTMCLASDDKIIIYGGYNSEGVLIKDINIITINETEKSIVYEVMQTTNYQYRGFHTAHTYKNRMYVFGGENIIEKSTNELWMLDLVTKNWRKCETSGEAPSKRREHSSVLSNDKLYLFGGFENISSKNDLWVLDMKTMGWNKILCPSIFQPIPRYGASAQEIDDKIYIFGGYQENGWYSNGLFVYSIKENRWEDIQIAGNTPVGRKSQTMISYKNRLFILGGYKKAYFKESYSLFCLNMDSIFIKVNPTIKKTQKIDLSELLLDKSCADVVLEAEGQELSAHQAILAGKSRMSESYSRKISFQGIKANTLKALLEFIYGKSIKINPDLAFDLLRLANEYLLPDLKDKCEEFLADNLCPDNIEKISKAPELNECYILLEAVDEFYAKNAQQLNLRANYLLSNKIFELDQSININNFNLNILS